MTDSAQTPAGLLDEDVGRYRLIARLGAGGMGEVYLAEDTQLHRQVALKRLSPELRQDSRYRTRLLNEARRASALNNPRIAGIYDVLEHREELFVVMEYVKGSSLRERLKKTISLEEFQRIALQCAVGLNAAHKEGILHSDIKPENIMLTSDGGEIKLCDFGLARRIATDNGNDTTFAESVPGMRIAGTPGYMSPEALKGLPLDARSDLFSLGVVLYEMLAGRHPFRGVDLASTLARTLSESPEPIDDHGSPVRSRYARIVMRLLAKSPDARYPSCEFLIDDLMQSEAFSPGAGKAVRAKSSFVAIALVALLLVAVVTIFWIGITHPIHIVTSKKNLVVIPFGTVGAGPDQRYLSDGLSETLNAKLVTLAVAHQLQVMPAADVRTRHVATSEDARKELGANLVVTGTLQYSQTLVRINCLLIDAANGQQLRADTVTAELTDPFGMQDRIAEAVVRMLEVGLQPVEQTALEQHGTQLAGAYGNYVQGRGYLVNYDHPENLDRAIELFRRALDSDPGYSLAYSGLGEAYWRKFEATKANDWVEPARTACTRALVLDSAAAAPRICIGTVDSGTGQYDKAVQEFAQAIHLDPALDAAYLGLGTAYERLKQTARAEQTYQQAIALRPGYWAPYSVLGAFYFRNAQYEKAREMFLRVIDLAPDSYRGYYNLGAVDFSLGHNDEAAAAFKKSLSIRENYAAASNLGTLLVYASDYAGAAQAFRRALKLNANDHVLWGNLGSALYWSGDGPGARDAYEHARDRAEERLKINSKDADVIMFLAQYHAALRDREDALRELQQALSLSPKDPVLMFRAAAIFEHNLGRRDDALQFLGKAVELGYSWTEIDHSPSFGELRKDPRFLKLRNRP